MPIDTDSLRTEFNALVAEERNALTDDPFLRQIVRVYDSLGGSRVRLKQIIVLGIELIVATELNADDLPYVPDDVIDPRILDRVRERVSTLVDNIFSGRPLLPQ